MSLDLSSVDGARVSAPLARSGRLRNVRRWRLAEGFVVQRGDVFLRLDASGAVLGEYGPRSESDEDDLWLTFQLVEGDRLLERTVIEHRGPPGRLHSEKVLATGLFEVNEPADRELAERAFARIESWKVREATAAQAAAEARVDAIEGARDDLDAGPLVARAQAALSARVARWDDATAASLLRTLIDLARERTGTAAVAGLARGCLLACFEHAVPELPLPASTPHASFRARLLAHADALDELADGQERVDANANAAAYARAATSIRWAADCLR